jgi:hypothetical protein
MYYTIFTTDTHAEYHVSGIRNEVLNRSSMSRRIKTSFTGAQVAKAISEWIREADFYKCEYVDTGE